MDLRNYHQLTIAYVGEHISRSNRTCRNTRDVRISLESYFGIIRMTYTGVRVRGLELKILIFRIIKYPPPVFMFRL